ncbi:hypothetical protein HDU93_002837, partial [Gonapodya sp. JEL0774]
MASHPVIRAESVESSSGDDSEGTDVALSAGKVTKGSRQKPDIDFESDEEWE